MKKHFMATFVLLACLGMPRSAAAQVSSPDSLALVDLYNSTGGASWTTKTNWLSGQPAGTWFGVTAAGGRVVIVNLSNNNLTGTIPSTIGNLGNIVSLQLVNNHLSGSIPTQVGNLVNLVTLGLDQNQLSGAIPASLSSLSIVSTLTLANNQLTDSVPAVFRNLPSLQDFEVQNNRLDVFPDLSSIGTLTTLKIEGNKFTFEDIEPNIGIATFTYATQDSVDAYTTTTANESGTFTMSVTVGGASNQYQWKKNNIAIGSATSSSYQINPVTITDGGTYTCDITNSVATALTLKRRTLNLGITGTPPGTPSALTATGVAISQINLSWTAGTGVINKYRIFRSLVSNSGFAQIDSVTSPTTTFANTAGLSSNTVYYYQVNAVGNFGVSTFSNTASDTTLSQPPVVDSPLPDTTLTEGFAKFLFRKLKNVFGDPDNLNLTYSRQANAGQITATVSADSLYLQGVLNYTGSATVIVTANDGSSSVSDTFNVAVAADVTGPAIANIQTPASVLQNTAFTVSSQITDNGAVASAKLYYQQGGTATFDSVAMTAAGSTYSAQIPASVVTTNGLALYISASDIKNNVTIGDTISVAVSFTQISNTIAGSQYPAGIANERWRLVSVPMNLDDKSISTLFQTTSTGLWVAYNSFGTKVTTINNGQGFWFFQKSGVDGLPILSSSGKTNPATGFQITLAPLWNLIGDPYPFSIPVTINPVQLSGLWVYSGSDTSVTGWAKETTLKPFGGYAVYNKTGAPVTMTITPTSVTFSKASSTDALADFKMSVKATGKRGKTLYGDEFNSYTLLNADNVRAYDDPEPAGYGDNISVYFSREGNKLSSIYEKPEAAGRSQDVYVESTLDGIDVHIDFLIEKMPGGWNVRIYDYARNQFSEAGEPITVQVQRHQAMKFKIIAGTSSYITETSAAYLQLPKNFVLLQNYPNPFNPNTEIKYGLAKQGRVALTIYNLLGQEIRTVVSNETQAPGYHSVQWDGKDRRGAGVASGVYIYRLRVETVEGQQFINSRKMLLIK